MTHRFTLPVGKRLDDAERLFAVLDGGGGTAKAPPISPSRLYRHAGHPDPTADPELARLLATDARLGRDFARLLARTGPIALDHVAAAASEAIPSRRGAGFRLRFEPSRVEPDQVYVILEFEGNAPPESIPESIIVVHDDGRSVTQALPLPQDGVIQILAEHRSELVTALADTASEVFLK